MGTINSDERDAKHGVRSEQGQQRGASSSAQSTKKNSEVM